MQDRFKFRGMDLEGRWFYGFLAITEEHGHTISNSKGMPFAYKVRPETVGQCTGIKDNTGILAYEGDILKAEQYNSHDDRIVGAVVWEPICSGFYPFIEIRDTEYLAELDSLRIIGNIWENPDLIKK